MPKALHVATRSVDQTRALAEALAALVRAGDVILLTGDLGAGKTAFVQGLGRGLGVEGPVTSPTFTLTHEYKGRLLVHHLDVYRLDQLSEVFDLGLPEMLDSEGVLVVEWGDSVAPLLPADYLQIGLRLGESDDDREISLESVGPSWSARARALADALAPWTSGQGSPPC